MLFYLFSYLKKKKKENKILETIPVWLGHSWVGEAKPYPATTMSTVPNHGPAWLVTAQPSFDYPYIALVWLGVKIGHGPTTAIAG